VDGYYGKGMTKLLRRNRGSHEPQEELVFADVLRRLEPGATMIECGAYWGFYSLWFTRDVPRARAWLIEPDAVHLQVGRRNFEANGLHATYVQALVGRRPESGEPQTVSIDDLAVEHEIDQLNLLHADIQGAEAEMLEGAVGLFSTRRIDFVFISTHGGNLHQQCVQRLHEFGYEVPISIGPEMSYSVDGLVVGHRPGVIDSPLASPSFKRAAAPAQV
jgi:hypothetical protein